MYIFIIQKNLKNIIIEYIVSIHKIINNSKLIYYEDETIIINKNNKYIFVGLSYTNYHKFNFENCYYINLEQLTMDGTNSNYDFLKPIIDLKKIKNNLKLLDYSYANVNILNKNSIESKYIPYQVNEEEIFNYEKKYDFVTCCSWNDRIMNIYNKINENIKNSYSIGHPILYGKERDDILFRSKILVNIHHREKDYFILEEIRIIRCILNKVIVISENSLDHINFILYKYIIFVDYDKLVEKTMDVLINYDNYYNKIFKDFDINEIDNLLSNRLILSLEI